MEEYGSEVVVIRKHRRLTYHTRLDVAEYSSGGKEYKKGITKTGNKHIRTILTGSCQTATKPPILGKRIKTVFCICGG
jgi:transposase